MIINKILQFYETENFVLRQKAKSIFLFSNFVIVFLIISIVSTYFISGFQIYVLLPETLCLLIIIYATWLLKEGKFSLAAHIIFSVSSLTIWLVTLFDPSSVIIKLDTVSFVVVLLAATPLIITDSKKPMWFYFIINAIALILVTIYYANSGLLTTLEAVDFLQDYLIVFSLVLAASYHIFSINHDALIKTKKVLEEHKKSEQSVRHLQVLLDNIINSMPSTLIGVNNDGQVIQWNQEAERLTGLSAKKANGSLVSNVFPQLKGELNKIYDVIETRLIHRDVKIPFLVDDTDRLANITIYPLITNGTDGAVIRIDDVTERVRLEEIMVQSEKMLAVGGLAAGMAHEINNPLAGMLQNAQVVGSRLTSDIPANKKVAEKYSLNMDSMRSYMKERGIFNMLDAIKISGERAARIIENMLKFSRRDGANHQMIDINDLINRTLELAANDYDLKESYDFKKIEIVKNFKSSLSALPCKEVKLQQVILNLLKNAAQALSETTKPTLSPRIVISTYQDKAYIYITVEDNGPGVPDEIAKHIFEPFFTTKSNKSGTGLGLSISYFIITEDHGGILRAESTGKQGTKFIIQLPLERKFS